VCPPLSVSGVREARLAPTQLVRVQVLGDVLVVRREPAEQMATGGCFLSVPVPVPWSCVLAPSKANVPQSAVFFESLGLHADGGD
jgi:hypothetical protein